jgi:probable F420-dependent oxidoreductase
LQQLAEAAVVSRRLALATGVYLLPLRHPAPVAKQIATLDHLTEGRLIFGVGVGGEFPKEYEVCGVPLGERGPRLSESIAVLRRLWTGEAVSHHGRFFSFEDVRMVPPPRQPGGPPIWYGGRSEAALRRTGRLADGWLSYVVTPETYAASLAKIALAAATAERKLTRFGTGHLLFTRLDDTYEKALDAATETLSVRYAMDFRQAARRYAALGTPDQVAERIRAFHAAGVRHISIDLLGPYEERLAQIERFAADVLPLLADLRGGIEQPAARQSTGAG